MNKESGQHYGFPPDGEKPPTAWNIISPLVLRNGTQTEIAELTDIYPGSVGRAIYHRKNTIAVGDYFSPENMEERWNRGRIGAARTRKGFNRTSHRRNSIAFMKGLLKEGVITNDTTAWNKLKQLYTDGQRRLPYNFADKLRLEFFLQARCQLAEGDQDLMVKYMEIGNSIDTEWFEESFAKEEDFIAKNLTALSLGHDGEDKSGLFILRDGRKWRQIGEADDYGLVFDSSHQATKREAARNS